MLWQGRRETENVEDARGSGGGGRIVLGGGIGTVILVVLYLLLGGDPQALFNSQLQADFLAGVWARYTDRVKHVVEAGDIEEAMRAASAVGDDRLQSRSRGYVVPDSFTHGTSEQRARWFRRGYETGDLSQGDTFNTRDL